MGKALVISVGTGVRGTQEALDSLASAIAYSIKNCNADKVFFVVSQESREAILPLIISQIDKDKQYEIIRVRDPDDIQSCYQELSFKFKEIRGRFDFVTVDYTSGTKAMTGTLVILGSLYEADNLTYVAGERHNGIVTKGLEKIRSVRPYFITRERKLLKAISFFNQCRFDACLSIIEEIECGVPDTDWLSFYSNPLKQASLAYSAWDKFNHEDAFNCLKQVKLDAFAQNKAFLGKLLRDEEKEPYYIADIMSNAQRRGEIEGKYDDAVARLYRVMELIGQYQLKKYGIEDTSSVSVEDIPQELKQEWHIEGKVKIKIALEKDYRFLAAKGDKLGENFLQDKELRNLLSKRNSSILAHGLVSVTENTYYGLKAKTASYASQAVKNLNQLLDMSTFLKWPE